MRHFGQFLLSVFMKMSVCIDISILASSFLASQCRDVISEACPPWWEYNSGVKLCVVRWHNNPHIWENYNDQDSGYWNVKSTIYNVDIQNPYVWNPKCATGIINGLIQFKSLNSI